MINGILLLADGFEPVEALGTQDVLRRTGQIQTDLVSISSSLDVISSTGVVIKAEKLLNEINTSDYDFIVLPGGKLGTENLGKSKLTIDIISEFYKSNKYVFAICAAPSILEKLGILDNKDFTCFPGFETGRANWIDQGVVKTGKIITGHSMGYTIPFGLEIVNELLGQEFCDKISVGIFGTK